MEIELKVLLDTEKKRDLDMVEELLFQLQDVREILEDRQENLNNNSNNKRRK
jgi:hypothetical protein